MCIHVYVCTQWVQKLNKSEELWVLGIDHCLSVFLDFSWRSLPCFHNVNSASTSHVSRKIRSSSRLCKILKMRDGRQNWAWEGDWEYHRKSVSGQVTEMWACVHICACVHKPHTHTEFSFLRYCSGHVVKQCFEKKTRLIILNCSVNIHNGLQAGCWSILPSLLFPLWLLFSARKKDTWLSRQDQHDAGIGRRGIKNVALRTKPYLVSILKYFWTFYNFGHV